MRKLIIVGGIITTLLTSVQATPFKGIKKCKFKVKHGTLRHRGFCPKWTIDNANSSLNY